MNDLAKDILLAIGTAGAAIIVLTIICLVDDLMVML